MIFGSLGVGRTHIAGQVGRDLLLGDAADFLHVEFAIKEVGVDPLAAAFEQRTILRRAGSVAGRPRHLLAGPQRAQIEDAALRVGAVELHVVGVVLHAFEDAILIGIPAARNPGELDGLLDARPHAAEPRGVAGKLPIEVGVHDLAHLAIGGGKAEALAVVGKPLAKTDAAGGVLLVAESGSAQRAGEAGEDVGGSRLVVPDVRAASVAAAGMVVSAFETVEFAVGGAEDDGGDQRGEVGAGGILNGRRNGGFAQGGGKAAGLL